jgi:hypothetical protein
MSIINEYTFFLNSKYRSSGLNASPIWNLGDPIVLSDNNNYFECQILNAEIPFSFKSIQAPNNTIKFTLVAPQDSINTSGTITILTGNYSITSLLAELKTQLEAIITNMQHKPTFNFTYDKESGKVTLDVSISSSNHSMTLTLRWSQSDIMAEYFGFTFENDTVLSYNTSRVVTSTNYISPNHVNVSPVTSLLVRSDNLNQVSNNQEILVEQQFTLSNILAKIYVNSYYNSWILWENDIGFSVRLTNKSIDYLQLYLTSLTYDYVLFDGVSWKVTIKIREIESPLVTRMKETKLQKMAEVQQLQQEKDDLLKQLEQIKNELLNNDVKTS